MTEAISMHRRRKGSEDGFTLLAVIFLLAILTLALAVAVPKVTQHLQRDREVEAMHRGKQYIRAIQLYYHKFHGYPPSLDALKNTNGIRFLRKEYVDPITGKNDWQPILFGQNKVPAAMGFFGQPLMGTTIAGTGPGGTGLSGNGLNESSGANGTAGAASTLSDAGSPGGQTFGGAGIIGVTIPREKKSILIYKKQDHYNQWEFVYDPIQESLGVKMEAVSSSSSSPTGGSTGSGGSTGNGSSSSGPSPWSPNGNLQAPGGAGGNDNGSPPSNPVWGPNGNLPSPQQPQ